MKIDQIYIFCYIYIFFLKILYVKHGAVIIFLSNGNKLEKWSFTFLSYIRAINNILYMY